MRPADRRGRARQRVMAKNQKEISDPRQGTQARVASSEWRGLWPAYCIGIGILLILVGALV